MAFDGIAIKALVKEFREKLTEAVLTAYRAAAEKEGPESGLEAE